MVECIGNVHEMPMDIFWYVRQDCRVRTNFSEGRNQEVIDAISNAGRGIQGARVLGIEPDADYNRTVLTIAGEPNAVSEAAFRGPKPH